jgi:hypothetical protein
MPPMIAAQSTIPNRLSQAAPLPGLRLWLLAVLLFAASIGGLEAYWRSQGFWPTVPDTNELWYFWRQRIYREDGKMVVLLGTSRVMADISLGAIQTALPGFSAIQLGESGVGSSIGDLLDLIADRRFRGTVICELDTPLLARSRWEDHKRSREYTPASSPSYLDNIAQAWIDDKLVIRRNLCGLRAQASRFVHPEPIKEPYEFRRQTFYRALEYDQRTVCTSQGAKRAEEPSYKAAYAYYKFPTWVSLAGAVRDLDLAVKQFQLRGGRVVFLRAPSSGERWQYEERFHSKQKNWNRFAASTAATCVHFRDVPAMRTLVCPDDSHLDCRDSPRFSEALVRELARRGVFGNLGLPAGAPTDSQCAGEL